MPEVSAAAAAASTTTMTEWVMDGVCYKLIPATIEQKAASSVVPTTTTTTTTERTSTQQEGWHWLRPYLGEDHSDDHEDGEEPHSDAQQSNVATSNPSSTTKTTERILGPIVGRYHTTTGEMDLDPPGYAGDYVMELLTAQRLSGQHNTLLDATTTTNSCTPPSHLVRDLERHGLAVWNNALSPETVHAWRQVLLSERHTILFRSSGQPTHVRSDQICFYNRREQTVSVLQRDQEDTNSTKADNFGGDDEGDNDGHPEKIIPSSSPQNLQKVFQQGFDFLEHVVWNVTGGNMKVLRSNNKSAPPSSSSSSIQQLPLLRPNQGMCAWYKGGDTQSHYTWHYDNERVKTTADQQPDGPSSSCWRNFRTLTAIVYLQPIDWNTQKDGGQLQCRVPNSNGVSSWNSSTTCTETSSSSNERRRASSASSTGEIQEEANNPPPQQDDIDTTTTVTIPPLGGTVVLFDSRRIHHCVQPAHRDRLAMTQWFVSPTSSGSQDDCCEKEEEQPRGPRLQQLLRNTKRNMMNESTSDMSPKRSRKGSDANQFCKVFSSKESSGDSLTTAISTKDGDKSSHSTKDGQKDAAGFSFGFFG